MPLTSCVPDVKRGSQKPRVDIAPPSVSDAAADDAIELAAMCGLVLDDWQQHVLRRSLGVDENGVWSAFEVGLCVSRQNGKGAVLLARELAGVLLFGDQLVIHSAHEAETSRNHMLEWLRLIDNSDLLRSKVSKTPMGRGSEAIEFHNGARIRFRTRTRGGGRGLSGDLVVVDEAFDLSTDELAALLPTLSARPNPQLWMASSAVDQMAHPNCLSFGALRARALSDDPGRVTWQEWSPEPGYDPHDPQVWNDTNPARGIRIGWDYLQAEHRSLPLRKFQVERLSDGDWPDPDGTDVESGGLRMSDWLACADDTTAVQDPVTFGVHVAPDRSSAAIVAAGWVGVGTSTVGVEVVDVRDGAAWVPARLKQLIARHQVARLVKDGHTLIDGWDTFEVDTVETGAADMAAACATLVDTVRERQLRHLSQRELDAAARDHKTRSLSGGVAFKSTPETDVTPLVAATLAVWGHTAAPAAPAEAVPFFITA